MIDVLIPTMRHRDQLADMLAAIDRTSVLGAFTIVSGLSASAAVNRNLCLSLMTSPVGIMLDDDIAGFYRGWDMDLIAPLRDESVAVVTARLMRPDGRVAQTCSRCYDLQPDLIEIQPARECVLPTAAIAFRNRGILFDEGFLGSGFEDGDWCFEYRRQFPQCRFLQSNTCRLVHLNEMKEQRKHWNHNKAYFETKWIRKQS
jgi:hypothetical protein